MPLTKLDEYPLQQLATTFDHVEDSDRRWFERYWMCVYDIQSPTMIVHGLGVYPNLDAMDAFALVVRDGQQRILRARRRAHHERMDTQVGPIAVRVVDGLGEVAIRLGSSELDITYDLHLKTTFGPVDCTRMPFERLPDGLLHQRYSTFIQAGTVSGTLRIDGQDVDVGPDWHFVRTNGWGIRSHPGGLDTRPDDPLWRPSAPFLCAEIDGGHICLVDGGGVIGDSDGVMRRVNARRTEVSLAAQHVTPETLRLDVTDDRGDTYELTATTAATAYLAGAFGGFKDAFHGISAQMEVTLTDTDCETEQMRTADPAECGRVAGRDDHAVVVRLGGSTGHGVAELGVRGAEPYAVPGQ